MLQMEERKAVQRAEPREQVTHENPVYSELLLQEQQGMYSVKDEMPPAEQDTAATAEQAEGHTY
jgi:hypothetical protein